MFNSNDEGGHCKISLRTLYTIFPSQIPKTGKAQPTNTKERHTRGEHVFTKDIKASNVVR